VVEHGQAPLDAGKEGRRPQRLDRAQEVEYVAKVYDATPRLFKRLPLVLYVAITGPDRSPPSRRGGSGGPGASPSTIHGPTRTARPLRKCTGSTKGSSGRSRWKGERGCAGSRGSGRGRGLSFNSVRACQARAELADLGFDLGEGRRQGVRSGDQHNVEGYSRPSTCRIIRSIR